MQLTPLVLREYDHLITVDKIENEDTWEECINAQTQFDTEALGDPNLKSLKQGKGLLLLLLLLLLLFLLLWLLFLGF